MRKVKDQEHPLREKALLPKALVLEGERPSDLLRRCSVRHGWASLRLAQE